MFPRVSDRIVLKGLRHIQQRNIAEFKLRNQDVIIFAYRMPMKKIEEEEEEEEEEKEEKEEEEEEEEEDDEKRREELMVLKDINTGITNIYPNLAFCSFR